MTRAPALLRRALPPGRQSGHVDLADQVEVRRAGPARRHALGHDAPHGADALLARRRAAPLGAPAASGREGIAGRDVRGEDGAARTRAAHGGDVHAALGGESPRLRRGRGQARAAVRAAADGAYRALHVGEHVGLLDLAAGGLDAGEIDAVLLGDLPGERRRLDAASRRRALDDADRRRTAVRGGGCPASRQISAIAWPTGTTSPSLRGHLAQDARRRRPRSRS